ncbi:MAG: hypothetical protein B7Z41_06720, partial [Rhizobiales bacterium 12-66-7]
RRAVAGVAGLARYRRRAGRRPRSRGTASCRRAALSGAHGGCAGGILGMGETNDDRIDMLLTLANMDVPPESVPINMLIPIPGSKLENAAPVDPIDFVRTIALARIMMPTSHVRLSAGRTEMSDELQAMCFFAGANSIFVGECLLTADNPGEDHDAALFRRLGISPEEADVAQ